jgi:hypothetical protein
MSGSEKATGGSVAASNIRAGLTADGSLPSGQPSPNAGSVEASNTAAGLNPDGTLPKGPR